MPIARRAFLVMLLTVPVAPARLIKRLEKLSPDMLFDMHGNADEDLQALMIARFDATAEITRTIDRLARERRNPKLVRALYHVLGFVKDPAAIPWLDSRVFRVEPRIFDRWWHNWNDERDGYGSWEWLEGRDRWLDFFQRAIAKEASETRRVKLLQVLAGFDDASVVSFFEAQQKRALSHREALEVATYEHVHGGVIDDQRIKAAVDGLAADPANHKFSIEIASRLRHPAFVPFLIAIFDDAHARNIHGSPDELLLALQQITFETGLDKKQEWQQWFATNGAAGREAWLLHAEESLRHRMQADEPAAVTFFEDATISWNDMAWLPFVERELMPRPTFRQSIAVWISMTYQPVYHARLEPLARELAPQAASFDPWLRDRLAERDLLPGRKKSTWADYVRNANNFI